MSTETIPSGSMVDPANPDPMLEWQFVEIDPDGDDSPCNGDYMIYSPAWGDVRVYLQGSHQLATAPRADEGGMDYLCRAILDDMEEQQFWPNVWYQNERGTLDLCVIRPVED